MGGVILQMKEGKVVPVPRKKKEETPTPEQKREVDAAARGKWNLRVFVIGGGFQYIKMFNDAGFSGARSVEDADIVCFTGGEDVDPQLYGEKAIPGTHFNVARDTREIEYYVQAVEGKKPMIGICRGAQFLNVMQEGGRLWQDVNNHAIYGHHDIVDMRTGKTVPGMTSTHHQQMIPGKNCEVIAMAELSTQKRSEKETIDREKPECDDFEVIWYPDTLALCFQPHPEFKEGECRDYFLDLVDEIILPAC